MGSMLAEDELQKAKLIISRRTREIEQLKQQIRNLNQQVASLNKELQQAKPLVMDEPPEVVIPKRIRSKKDILVNSETHHDITD